MNFEKSIYLISTTFWNLCDIFQIRRKLTWWLVIIFSLMCLHNDFTNFLKAFFIYIGSPDEDTKNYNHIPDDTVVVPDLDNVENKNSEDNNKKQTCLSVMKLDNSKKVASSEAVDLDIVTTTTHPDNKNHVDKRNSSDSKRRKKGNRNTNSSKNSNSTKNLNCSTSSKDTSAESDVKPETQVSRLPGQIKPKR